MKKLRVDYSVRNNENHVIRSFAKTFTGATPYDCRVQAMAFEKAHPELVADWEYPSWLYA